jgi:Calcineurin-like phosphoesterase
VAHPPISQKKMVGWYAPSQLAKTGVEVAISTIFGRHSDHRLVEAMASGDDVPGDAVGAVPGENPKPFYDYSHHHIDDGTVLKRDLAHQRESIWIDYVGDVGDGWNSTYAVAHYLADPAGLKFEFTERETGAKRSVKTERGEILIFGGDEVYPTASRQEYEDRLVVPYQTALRNSPESCPHVFAIPGNHDWYDSLVSFTRLFTARPWFAGWRTRQSRSYFALKLPHNWWLLGTDLQLGSDIDKPQMEYFASLAEEMDEETKRSGDPARVIVCHAEPHWIRAAQYGGEGEDPNYSESNLKLLEKRLGQNVAVFIAGDLHHYRRHESEDKTTQKITAGGGGAFLHPTHAGLLGKSLDKITEVGLWDDKQQKFETRDFRLEGCFPSTKESAWLCLRNLQFPFFVFQGNQSWSFGLVIAALYLLLTLPVIFSIDDLAQVEPSFGPITYSLIQSLIHSPVSVALILATLVGFWFFTDTHSKRYKAIMGLTHAVAHVLAACAVALLTVFWIEELTTPETWTFNIPWPGTASSFSLDLRLLLAVLLVFVLGFVVGSFIMGLYLLLSLNFWGRHGNEAFSSLGIEDFKNFIRLHINEKGDLTIYPIGIRRVPRKWKDRESGTGPELISDDPKATKPELIELPILMQRAVNTETGVVTTSPDTPIDCETQ